MVDLSKRITGVDEIMDDFALPASELEPVLKGLANLNEWFGGHNTLLKALQIFPVQPGNRIADWGCGGGDSLRAIANWAQRQHIPVKLTGIDAAPATVAFAKRESAAYSNINYRQADVMNDAWSDNQFDIIVSTLFTHHFEDADWIRLIQKMYAAARRGIIITDLHRHWLLYYSLIVITSTIIPNKMMRYDSALSVRRSFKKSELKQLLDKAGITNYKIRWKWAFRWEVIIYKS